MLSFCYDAGLAQVGKAHLDGTKVQINGSLAANRTLAHLEQEIEKMHKEMKAADAVADAGHGKKRWGDELTPELQRKHERLARFQHEKPGHAGGRRKTELQDETRLQTGES